MSEYIRFSENYNINTLIPITESPYKLIKGNKPYFISMMKYNQSQFEEWKKTNSLKLMSGGKTNKIWADFDSEDDLKLAFKDCQIFVSRLINLGFKEENIQISFSGNKGTGVIVETEQEFSIDEVSRLCTELALGLKTFDTSMYDHQRIFRLLFSKNEKTGLYKTPITLRELQEAKIDEIKTAAKDLSTFDTEGVLNWYKRATNIVIVPKKVEEPVVVKTPIESLEMAPKPPHWKNYKWSIAQGFFDSGERHQALMVLAATCRGLGYTKDLTYSICRSAVRMQAQRTGSDEFAKEELYKNIIEDSIFSDNWEGGQYSPKTNLWLAKYCEKMGFKVSDDVEEVSCIEVLDMEKQFTDYAKNFEQNIVKTGIKGVDKNVLFLASTHNGLLGAPGAGKTAFSLEYLRNSSMAGINSVFLSLDMGLPMIYSKLVQRATGMSFQQVMDFYKGDPKKARDLTERIKEDYKNVSFNFKSGVTVADMKTIIKNEQERTGKPIKLLVTDYLECIAGPYSDATANTGFICNQLKDLANEMNVCSLLLLQTQKHSTGEISDPLLSMRQIKGSSVIEQSCSVVLTLWREGYSPKTVDDDKYISFASVKNRFGSLWTDDFGFDGKRGAVHELTEEELGELSAFKERKKLAKIQAEKERNGQWE